eukprot:CAMPEP_0115278642 /NCGR_PEP_ID=MMETSP0270-20121206/57858_1 /TAXON_ID=71861 /ORGANISM="Scrippsiella trochoidea, Strain CCMP3099" /LENGTH=309 /DNA_ID=CAMNT_0002695315 /DNA_START=61 /DNA_END=990 /DNA_ORIENTATION=-
MTQELESRLERAGLPVELMPVWAARERRVFALGAAASPKASTPTPVRHMALEFLQSACVLYKLPHSVWFEAVHLLDVFNSVQASALSEDWLCAMPATCLAIFDILRKSHNAVASPLSSQRPLRPDSQGFGPGGAVRLEDVTKQELAILQALEWQVSLPSMISWMDMLRLRFNAMTMEHFASSMDWIGAAVFPTARLLVLWRPCSADRAPRSLGFGLFCLGLVHAQLVPLQALRPPHVYDDEWEELFMQSHNLNSLPDCVTQGRVRNVIVDLLQAAADCSLEELQCMCELTMGCLRGCHAEAGLAAGSTA